jgi:hypothetical protein
VRLVCVAVNFGMGQWGEEVFLTLARAATDHEKRERFEPSTHLDAWKAEYKERIAAAEALLASLPENELDQAAPTYREPQAGVYVGTGGTQKSGGESAPKPFRGSRVGYPSASALFYPGN